MSNECPICYDNTEIKYTECNHGYCLTCLCKLSKCAMCRKQLTRNKICHEIINRNKKSSVIVTRFTVTYRRHTNFAYESVDATTN